MALTQKEVSLRQLIEWYIPEDEYLITIKEEFINFARIPTDFFKEKKAKKIMIGFTEGLFVISPTEDERGLNLHFEIHGGSFVQIPKHLKLWLDRKGISGNYEAEINDIHSWIQTRNKIED